MNAGDSGAPWWRGAVIYQVYPRSYKDTNGDGVGDLRGIRDQMAHIASLGVDAVWLAPFFRSPMADMGYDVSDYCDVDPIFGTLEDFDLLVAEAHRLGLKVMIDQVLSHSSDRHPWFQESRRDRTNPRADWYVWADAKPDGTPPNNWLAIFGGPSWEWESGRRQYYMHNFLASQPDLNFHNEEVRAALMETMRFWLDRGVDGFRLDTVNYYFHDSQLRDNPPYIGATNDIPDTNPYGYQDHIFDKSQPENIGFLKALRALLDSYPERTSVGEVGDGARSLATVAAYTEGGDKLHVCYTFDLLGPVFSAAHVAACVRDFESIASGGWICWAMSNHDVPRHVSRFTRPGDDPNRVAAFALSLLACLRGSICLYQGEELGLTEADLAFEDLRDPYGIRFWPGFKGRDGCRTPMVWTGDESSGGFTHGRPWLPVPPEHLAMAVDRQEADPASTLNHYRAVLAWRRRQQVLVAGDVRLLSEADDVLAFVRSSGDDKLLCIFNFNAEGRRFEVEPSLGEATALDFPGARARVTGAGIDLEPLGVFVGRLA